MDIPITLTDEEFEKTLKDADSVTTVVTDTQVLNTIEDVDKGVE